MARIFGSYCPGAGAFSLSAGISNLSSYIFESRGAAVVLRSVAFTLGSYWPGAGAFNLSASSLNRSSDYFASCGAMVVLRSVESIFHFGSYAAGQGLSLSVGWAIISYSAMFFEKGVGDLRDISVVLEFKIPDSSKIHL